MEGGLKWLISRGWGEGVGLVTGDNGRQVMLVVTTPVRRGGVRARPHGTPRRFLEEGVAGKWKDAAALADGSLNIGTRRRDSNPPPEASG
ncbi:hypothetical protein D187_004869 [Cystobacter fuscus DSM 2262]|uniref:Uncharacterized protein n=1 Tax=Cystobacter fuscus (strain ATCC 25194 / DSM 2262 / NBRC 100088 / M29) TaxID=1242864 RepID=S9Q8J4_CYSF2|nr:hypothetical protein D187_004869 [Cystobacter fuscus DSM 2262]